MSSKLLRFALLTVLAALVAVPIASAALASRSGAASDGTQGAKNDNRLTSLDVKKQALLEKGLRGSCNGKANGKVDEVARASTSQLAREGEGAIWTVLGEFADLPHNTIAGARPRGRQHHHLGAGLQPRLLHGPAVQRDARRQLDAQLLHRAVVRPLHGRRRRRPTGCTVPGNAASLRRQSQTRNVWNFLQDSHQRLVRRSRSRPARPRPQINAYLSQFDVWDRYDYDGDGNFDEPDGYIDTFQSVHAGEGEEAGGAGDWTIWSHSWYAYYDADRHRRPRLQQARRHPDRRQRLLGRQVHHPARERRRGRLHPRVRPRPRPARPVRHLAARTAPASGR